MHYSIAFICTVLASIFTITDPTEPEYVRFLLNKHAYSLSQHMTPRPLEPSDADVEAVMLEAQRQSNVYLEESKWVQIIRQDDLLHPNFGIGLSFKFDPEEDTLPHRPQKVAMQFKNFNYGGQHFSNKDTANFSGLFNEINADIILEITDFQEDTIAGKFIGVLISGSGKMVPLEDGEFRIGLHRN